MTGDVLERVESFERIGIRGGGRRLGFALVGLVFGFFGFGGIGGDARFMTAFLIGGLFWLAGGHASMYIFTVQ